MTDRSFAPGVMPSSYDDEITMREMLAPIVQGWRTIVSAAGICGILAVVAHLVLPAKYEARTTFIPEQPRGVGIAGSLGALTGIAGQLGLPSFGSNSNSPELSAELLQSREVLYTTIMASLPDPWSAQHEPRPLLDLLDIRSDSPGDRVEKGISRLRKSIATAVDRRTGIVSVSVRSNDPELAAGIANLLTAVLDSFNVRSRQFQSRTQRIFAERQLADAQRELRDAEEAQLRFLTANRLYQESPVLRFEANRLERALHLKQEVYVTLSNAYEQARIAEVRDTPLLTVIDRAVPPIQPATIGRAMIALVGSCAGALLGVVVAFFAHRRAGLSAW